MASELVFTPQMISVGCYQVMPLMNEFSLTSEEKGDSKNTYPALSFQ